MDPMQALAEMDAIIQRVNLPREQHAHLIKCRMTVEKALTNREAAQ